MQSMIGKNKQLKCEILALLGSKVFTERFLLMHDYMFKRAQIYQILKGLLV